MLYSRSLPSCYRKHEQDKRRVYEERVREIEHGCFTQLVFSAAGGMGPAAQVVVKRLANLISIKYDTSYTMTLNWLRCRLNFSLLRSAIMCIRGSRSAHHRPDRSGLFEIPVDTIAHECGLVSSNC